MIKFCLKCFGKKCEVSYWIVVMYSIICWDGCFLEELGFYNFCIDEICFDVLAIVKRLKEGV